MNQNYIIWWLKTGANLTRNIEENFVDRNSGAS